MTMRPLLCNHCGTALEVPEGTRLVTCPACASPLEMPDRETAVIARAPDLPTAAMTPAINEIERQDKLALLDRAWEREREEFLIPGRFGRTRIPRMATGLVTMIVGVVLGVLLIGMTVATGAPVIFSWLGGLFVVSVVIGSAGYLRKARLYRAREAEYQRRRGELDRS